MKELISALEKIRDDYKDNYALTEMGFKDGINEAIRQINLTIPIVVGQSEQLIDFLLTIRERARDSKEFKDAGDLLKQIEKIN